MPRNTTTADAPPCDLSVYSVEELRWDFGIFAKSPYMRKHLQRELERRGASVDGPAQRRGGPIMPHARWKGRVSKGQLLSEESQ